MKPALVAAFVSMVAVSRAALADDLVVDTQEYGPWSAAVAAIESSGSATNPIHVRVVDRAGAALPCGSYALHLDAAASAVFRTGACDPRTGATSVEVVDRAAMFDHGDLVARPRAMGIAATQVRVGSAVGRAEVTGGSDVECSVAVRPYLDDLELGTRVYLSPGRFVLRSLRATLTAESTPDGWTLRGARSAGLAAEYEVFDTARSQVVVHDRATLSCGSASLLPPAAPPTVAPPVPAAAVVDHASPTYAASDEATPAALSGRPGRCPELRALNEDLASLPVAELEQRLLGTGLLPRWSARQQLEGIRNATNAYASAHRACMYRVMLVQSIATAEAMVRARAPHAERPRGLMSVAGDVRIDGADVRVAGGRLVIERGGSIEIAHGGSLTIGGATPGDRAATEGQRSSLR